MRQLDFRDETLSTRGPEVLAARKAAWCARTPFGLAVLRHRAAGALLRDRRLRQGSHNWPGSVGLTGSFAEFWSRSIIGQEGPGHKTLRKVAQIALAEPHITALIPEFEACAERIARRLPPRFDALSEVTAPFSSGVLGALLGLDDGVTEMGLDASTLGLAMGVTAAQHEADVDAAHDRLADLARRLIADRHPGMVARLVQAYGAEGLTDPQALIDLIVIIIFGAVDTTRGQLAFALELFADHPAQWDALRQDPALARAAIEEAIRHRPTTTWATRQALENFELDGVTVQEGEVLHILVNASATESLDPPGFDITARRPVHFGFGGGAHHCLGALVARTDMAAALRVFARSWTGIVRDGPARYQPDSGNTAPEYLPLRIRT